MSQSIPKQYLQNSDSNLSFNRKEEHLCMTELLNKQKAMIEELEKLLLDSDEENKKLNQVIKKMEQRDKNKTLFYQSKISELEDRNEEYRCKIELYQNGKKEGECSANKKKMIQTSFPSHRKCFPENNNENFNVLNISLQEQCSNVKCQRMQQIVKEKCLEIKQNLENVFYSIRVRSFGSHEKNEWSRKFQEEKVRRKTEEGKNSLIILQKLQLKIKELEQALEHGEDMRQSDPILKTMKSLKQKETFLNQIPFLEKIDLTTNLQEYNELLSDCKSAQSKMLALLKEKE